MAKPAKCMGCGREIHADWHYCRPCAIARRDGSAPATEACAAFKPDPYWPKVSTCDSCGYEGHQH